MKKVVWYKISILGLLIIMFTLSYLLGSFVYGEDSDYEINEPSASISSAEIQGPTVPVEATVEKTYYNVPLSQQEQDFVSSCCRAYRVPIEFAYAIMKIESDFDRSAVSGCDYGIMQINVINHESMMQALQISDFLDFYDNVKCGIYLLGQYYYKYNDYNMAAMCYHFGQSGAGKYWANGIYSTPYTDAMNEAMNGIYIDNCILR